MRKPYNFKELSDVRCGKPDCGKALKRNVVARNPMDKLLLCWEHWIMKTRNMTLAAYKKYRKARAEARRRGEDQKMIKA